MTTNQLLTLGDTDSPPSKDGCATKMALKYQLID